MLRRPSSVDLPSTPKGFLIIRACKPREELLSFASNILQDNSGAAIGGTIVATNFLLDV